MCAACCLFQYIIIPTRRSTAEAVQILFSHLFGDAGSPYLIGVVSKMCNTIQEHFQVPKTKHSLICNAFKISDAIHVSDAKWMNDFLSLQYAIFFSSFVCVLGGFFFLMTSLHIEEDKLLADQFIASNYSYNIIILKFSFKSNLNFCVSRFDW